MDVQVQLVDCGEIGARIDLGQVLGVDDGQLPVGAEPDGAGWRWSCSDGATVLCR